MLRLIFCALHLTLAVAFSMPGCANRGQALRPREPAEEPSGLPVGSAAPEIAGEDVDGAFCKLSDYRGKVVLLDFWGNW
jgi:hypothetical protein